MANYLAYTFEDTEDFISTYDELPLWSAPFGLLLLKNLDYAPNLNILDIGCGAGFPLLEIAARFGQSCQCTGLDVWKNGNYRTAKKIKNYNLGNVTIVEGSAENMPFANNNFDLIVSNLGLNNFENPTLVIQECKRVLKPKGKIAITTNLDGHWKEFYKVFEGVLVQMGKEFLLPKLNDHQAHRGTVESISYLFTENGFTAPKVILDTIEMKYTDGSAFLNHYFVKMGWLQGWKDIIGEIGIETFFPILEHNLNQLASNNNSLTLTVPIAYFSAINKAEH